jgi:hypothetical protein
LAASPEAVAGFDQHPDWPARRERAAGVSGQAGGQQIGDIDTAAVAARLEALRADLAAHLEDSASDRLQLDEVVLQRQKGTD